MSTIAMDAPEALALLARIGEQGGAVRDIKARVKAGEAGPAEADAALTTLLALKGEFKALTGQDVPAPAKQGSKKDKKANKAEAGPPPVQMKEAGLNAAAEM